MLKNFLTVSAVAWACALAGAPAAMAQPKPRIERAADMPRFTYKIDGTLEEIVRSGDRFAPLAAAIRRDIEAVLAGYEIPDKGTQRDLIATLAALDFLDGQYERSIERLQAVKALQDKPADKLLSGLRLRVMAQAAKAQAAGSEGYRRAVAAGIRRELDAMPYAVIENDIKGAKAGAELMGEALMLGRVREVLQPIVDKTGALSNEFAPGLISVRLGLVAMLPLKSELVTTYSEYLAAHRVQKADIWAARDLTLPAKGPTVVLGVWDSGIDFSLFGKQVRREQGKPALIAFDKYARPSANPLPPLPPGIAGKIGEMTARTKGFSDLQSNIDSEEATQVKQLLSSLTKDQYKRTIEELLAAGNYEHGTHVSGIALAGNPQARLVFGRLEFGATLMPDPCPSKEQAQRDAASFAQTVAFFQRHRARVVNMSWGGSVVEVEGDLERCGMGKTPDERKAMAREIFDIGKQGLTQAMAGAPQILFVAAAGNSNSDATFNESMPADIVLPNLLTVGAVDRAGDEAPFTSYGPTVKVHANGYQVESLLPGGARVALSGTSMAAPQVTNLAAKLLVLNPKLTTAQLIEAIVGSAEKTADGRRVLMHPKKAAEVVQGRR
ncbi:MAG: S8 family serine peptidase [Burkholderiaceae bacterium]|nr:S8 family serine peptidase [Aquabacterium sp.]NUP84183.1 S8 family serine peptidase [Burkholderiaceae bacterium]